LNFKEIDWKILENLEFNEIWPTNSLLHVVPRRNKFQANMGQEFEFSLKVEFGLIYR
jgi:hypothetical protein